MVWDLKRFGDVCDFVRGPFGGSLKKSIFKPDGHAVYEQQHAIYNQFEDIRYFIDKEKFSEMSRFELKPNDLIMSCSGTMGKIAIVPNGIKQGIINQALLKLTPKDTLLPVFLKLWMDSPNFQQQIEAMSQGAAIKNMASVKILKEIKVPVPKVSEQQRIVAILDQAFADIEKARANAEKNLKNARELFDSYLNQVFSQRGKGFELKIFGDVCHFVRGPFGGSLKKSIFKQSGYAVYEQQHAIYDQFESIRYFIDKEKFSEMARFELKPGDLIMSCSGTMGKIAIVPEGIKQGIINQALLKLTPSELLIAEYLKFWMTSRNFQEQIESLSQGAAIKNMASVKILKEIEVPVLKIEEQVRILSKLKRLFKKCKSIEDMYAKKLESLDELKKSLLQKAFSGELTKAEGHAA